jgi:uncharacterized glyoxalase superfamily protein PhnB
MLANRSMPPGTVIPELPYVDVHAAAEWLCRAFGFYERLRIGDHRVQLRVGDAAIVVVQQDTGPAGSGASRIMVRVADVDAHHARAVAMGAQALGTPVDYPYGERQYSAVDLGGHRWTFSQSIADVDPAAWGGQLIEMPK